MDENDTTGDLLPSSMFDSSTPLKPEEWPMFIASLHMLIEQHIKSQPFGQALHSYSSRLHGAVDGLGMMMKELYECDEFPEVMHARRHARGASCMVVDALLTMTSESEWPLQRAQQQSAIVRIRATLDEMVIGNPL